MIELPRLIGLSGYARSGKDTVAGFLADYGYTRIAFADALRDALYALNPLILGDFNEPWRLASTIDQIGWDIAKTEHLEIRELLQRFGTDVGRRQWGDDFWVNIAMTKAEGMEQVVIPDVRFPSEALAIHRSGGEIWRIKRPGIKPVNGHPSETALDDYRFDRYIENDGMIDDLATKVFES